MKTKNYVKLGFLKGLITIEASTYNSAELQQFIKLYQSTVIAVCILAAIALVILIILKISVWHLPWVVPTAKTGLSLLGRAWRYLSR